MYIRKFDLDFSICKINNFNEIAKDCEMFFTAKTDEEISLVCPTSCVPLSAIAIDHGWRAFRIEENLDFSLIGVLSNIAMLLAKNKISIFAISTYNTDYILTKKFDFDKAIEILKNNGYNIID